MVIIKVLLPQEKLYMYIVIAKASVGSCHILATFVNAIFQTGLVSGSARI